MTTATKTSDRRQGGDQYAILDHLANDPTPTKYAHRNAIIEAIAWASQLGTVPFSAADVRPHLPEWVDAHRIGAITSALIKRNVLVKTGAWAESHNTKSRNSLRAVPVYRVASVMALAAEVRS